MSVASARVEGEALVVQFRGGGEGTIASRLVDRVDPDEVAWPVEAVDASAAPVQTPGMPDLPGLETLAAKPFGALIANAAATHGVDVRLVHAVIEAESNYQPRARSPKGAKGLMQLMPDTARQYKVRDPYDPLANIDAGVRHLKSLLGRFDLTMALAAYNAGEGAVRRYNGLPPFAETRSYVTRILRRVGAGM
ncbi:MAG: lytic transglycosylase domain-containing protein [Acidobacteria bacterium]|nr:lytic transglycosylase domain-containing protein [Acidobacteriota bacterium]